MEEETKKAGRSRKKKEDEPFDLKKEIISWIQIIVAAVVIAFFLTTFIIANSRVPSNSMETTIMTGDRIIGSRLAYITGDPQRGDIVIFNHKIDTSGKETRLVKRVIGLPGETVEISGGRIYINGSPEPLEEPYLHEEMRWKDDRFEVPEGCYLMMGDNRNYSRDARAWDDPYVPKKKIIAKVLFRYFPSIGKIE